MCVPEHFSQDCQKKNQLNDFFQLAYPEHGRPVQRGRRHRGPAHVLHVLPGHVLVRLGALHTAEV